MYRNTNILQIVIIAAICNISLKHESFDDADGVTSANEQSPIVVDSNPASIVDETPVFLKPSLRHGLDTTVSPCDDFDQYVNGGWRAETQLPKDVKVLDVFRATSDQTKKLLARIVDSASRVHQTTPDAHWRLVGQYHASCLAADSLDRSMRALSMVGAQKNDTSRTAQCTRLVINDLQDAVGQLFVDVVVPKTTEARVQQLLNNIRSAASQRIDKLPWLNAQAKSFANESLAKMILRVAKPKTTIDYRGLVLTATDIGANQRKVKEFLWQHQIARTGRSEPAWSQNQFTANALYQMNSIEVPAFMFQWPMFDPSTDETLSYAGVGMIIGHETYHGITEHTGAQASEEYTKSAEQLKAQYSDLPKVHGVGVNGARTLNENLADLGGVLVAYDAWYKNARKRAMPTIDGFTPEQRFFIHYARFWRSKPTPDYISFLTNDVHAPHHARINGVVANVPAFAKAFACRDGDSMARGTGNRVDIW